MVISMGVGCGLGGMDGLLLAQGAQVGSGSILATLASTKNQEEDCHGTCDEPDRNEGGQERGG